MTIEVWRKASLREYSLRQTLRKDRAWLKVHDKLYQWVRVAAGGEPSPREVAVSAEHITVACKHA